MFNSLVLATVSTFNGNVDKNGKTPIILNILAGKCPNRNVLSGTIAERMNLKVGKSYLFQVREIDSNEFGRQFVYTVAGEATIMDILTGSTTLGQPEIFSVDTSKQSTPETPKTIEQVTEDLSLVH